MANGDLSDVWWLFDPSIPFVAGPAQFCVFLLIQKWTTKYISVYAIPRFKP